MKSVEDTLLGRRSIRRYERQPIEREKLDLIYAAIRNTPTSYNGQQFSVIAVTDQTVKEELYEITGQKQIKTSAILLVFCLDYHKLRVAAAESLGLGCCCVGYVRTADPRRISDMLGLPEGVSIVCGLTIGYPREMPDLKPKLPVEAVVHEGRYMPDEKLAPLLETYDRQVAEFNRSRTGDRTDNDWAGHIADYHRHSMEHGIGEYLEKQIGLEK